MVTFYEHKPRLSEVEKRVYKRLTHQDQATQTDREKETIPKLDRNRIPIIRLPTPLAMESVEKFLANNHWRLVDLFRLLDRDKSWKIVKEDFTRLVDKVKITFILKN